MVFQTNNLDQEGLWESGQLLIREEGVREWMGLYEIGLKVAGGIHSIIKVSRGSLVGIVENKDHTSIQRIIKKKKKQRHDSHLDFKRNICQVFLTHQ